MKRHTGERPVSAFVHSFADSLVGRQREHDLARSHHLAYSHGFQGEDVFDDNSLLTINDIFPEPEVHETIDILNAHVLLFFVFASPAFGKRKAEPDNPCTAENLGNIIERYSH